MKTSNKIVLVIVLLTTIFSNAQEKLKGNRIVTSENRNISEFNKVEVIDNLTVELIFAEEQEVIVKTDSNLQSVVLTEVVDGTLAIKTSTRIVRKKDLTVIVKVNKNLLELYAYNNAKIISNNLLKIDSLAINAFDNSDFSLQISSNVININGKKTSDLKIDALCNILNMNLEETSSLKGNFNTKRTNVKLTGKSSLSAVGNIQEALIETTENSSFKGRELEIKNAEVRVSNNSKTYINCLETIDIYANNNTETYIYSNPKIKLSEFFDKATLYKRNLDKKLF